MPHKDPEVNKAYRKAYTERTAEQRKAYYEENKEKRKEYYQQNKEKLNDYNKARYRAIKELIGDQKIEINLSELNQTQK